MDRKTVGLVGVVSALAAPGLAAQAAPANPSAVPVAASYAELLEPIPNAVERLKVVESEDAARPPQLVEAQYGYAHHHHHHHYRRRYYRPRFVRPLYHHHHHHHHNS